MAGLLFFKYSIEHDLISPPLRVTLGILVGLGCVLWSEKLRSKYGATANALAGGGVIVLYATFWAARVLYNLIGVELAFGLMALTTAVCCLVAVRRGSLIVTLLGLAGGFATPLLLASAADRPISLFGYILLLDAGFIYIAYKRRWAIVSLLSLGGTVLIQALWIGSRMGPHRLTLGLGILGLFALVYAVAGAKAPEGNSKERQMWLVSQAGAILMPYAFALYFAANSQFGPHLYPIAILVALLAGGASWVALRTTPSPHMLPLGAAASALAVVAVFCAFRELTVPLAWEVSACCLGIALVFHVFAELKRSSSVLGGSTLAGTLIGLGLFAVLLIAGATSAVASPWPWIFGWVTLAALLYRQAGFPRRGKLQLVVAVALGLGFSTFHIAHSEHEAFPHASHYFATEVLIAALLLVAALARPPGEARRMAVYSASALPIVLLVGLLGLPFAQVEPPVFYLGPTLILGIIAAIAATRTGEGGLLFAAMVALANYQVFWTFFHRHMGPARAKDSFGILLVSVLIFSFWPLFAGSRFKQTRWAWYASALAAPAWFLALKELYEIVFGSQTIGILPLALAVLSLGTMLQARKLWAASDPMRKSVLVWYLAIALGFISVAIPLQLDKQWITIGWALEGLAVTALWKRLDHPGLKWFGLALQTAVTVRLVLNPAIFDYYARGEWRIVNWLLYTYWVPAACLIGTCALLLPLEVTRSRDWEKPLYTSGQAVGAVAAALGAIFVVFTWINVAIADWFSPGSQLIMNFERQPAKDLTTSIAWVVYAIVLLAIGMAMKSRGLRWVSLVFFIVTIGKVFLYDLGQLRDLYRVMSLLGLAVSLIVVSLAYQRFVFRTIPKLEKSS